MQPKMQIAVPVFMARNLTAKAVESKGRTRRAGAPAKEPGYGAAGAGIRAVISGLEKQVVRPSRAFSSSAA